MTRENLEYSYAMSQTFFSEHFPKYRYRIMTCRTWLLDPVLKNLLPASSRILNFQSDYQIINITHDDKGFIIRVFKKRYDDYSLLPENTTLQRNLKKLLLSGGDIGLATGIFVRTFRGYNN